MLLAPGSGSTGKPGLARVGHQAGAGVADGGRAGIAHIGHAQALAQPLHHRLRRLRLVVLVQRQQLRRGFVDAIGAQQGLGVARVLTGDQVGQLQHMQGAQADVGQVADRRGHHIQGAARIILLAARLLRGRRAWAKLALNRSQGA